MSSTAPSTNAEAADIQRAVLEIIRGQRTGFTPAVAKAMLWLASGAYRLGAGFRNTLFDLNLKQAGRVGAKVISVGNLTVGGTGKTPMVEWLGGWVLQRGYPVVVLSRGYGQKRTGAAGGPVPGAMNDEGLLLQANLDNIHLVLSPDRLRAAETALEHIEPKPECFIMDDGFQHRRLARDLDILLIDALNPFGYGHLLPRGLLREPVKNMKRADVIIITRADQIEKSGLECLQTQIRRRLPEAPVLTAMHKLKSVLQCSDLSPVGSGWLKGKRIYAFCGLGNPEGFRRELETLGGEVVACEEYPDHHWYSDEDFQGIVKRAREAEAELLLTTQKDAVKFDPELEVDLPFLCLRIGIEILEGEDELTSRLIKIFPEERPAVGMMSQVELNQAISFGERPKDFHRPWEEKWWEKEEDGTGSRC
ncbi:MAG: tetraacyldisaccharide 4'-kinase [Planctomycetota bacterium]|nr:tetraacyldisaccharide 4'-kinase [Planctomycetota bacterium]MDA1142851.1 tetraacyldisaccharide 4'-kinase [Planctomycetota bacterium]